MICPECHKLIKPGDYTIKEQGVLYHFECKAQTKKKLPS